MSRGSARDELVIGAPPRANLLPPEVAEIKRGAAIRRRLAAGVLVIAVATGFGYAVSAMHAAGSQAALDAERDRTANLLALQAELSEVRTAAAAVGAVTIARLFGASTEVNWQSYMAGVEQTLPAGVTIVSYTADAGTPVSIAEPPTAALEGPRIGSIALIGEAADLTQIEAWLVALRALPGFVDARPGSVNVDDAGVYTFDIIMHINEEAYSNRFLPPTEPGEGTETETETETGTETETEEGQP